MDSAEAMGSRSRRLCIPADVLWAVRSLLSVRRQLRTSGVGTVRVPEAVLRGGDERPIRAVLKCARASCLERSLVRQEWHRVHGHPVDVVIGVTSPAAFEAHAWLDGEEGDSAVKFAEIRRHPPGGA